MNGRTNSNGTITDTLQIPLDPVTNLDAVAGNAQVTLTWTDPLNKYATPEGEQAGDPDQLVSVWSYTAIVRKEGSAPTGIHDGILVAESQVHNQYQTIGYVDSGLTNDTLYYYGLFAVNEDGIESEVTASEGVTPTAGVPISELPVGQIVKINENGAPIEYIIVHIGNPGWMYDQSCDGYWLLRKDIAERHDWDVDGTPEDYSISTIHTYLNDEWMSRYESGFLSVIKTVKVPYTKGTFSDNKLIHGANGVSCKFFLLSLGELNLFPGQYDMYITDGIALSYFNINDIDEASLKRIATYNGRANTWMSRTRSENNNYIYCIDEGGIPGHRYSYDDGVRPALILPYDIIIDHDMNVIT